MDWLNLETWVTSDQHWSHHNIRRYQGRPEDHFEIMWERWNMRVGVKDTVLHLGDLVYGGDKKLHDSYLKGLNGKKYLVLGNHDKHTHAFYEKAGFTVLGREGFLKVFPGLGPGGDFLLVRFSHEPDTHHLDWDINIHGHIHGNPYYSSTPNFDYRNISVEVTDYAPVRLKDVLNGTAGAMKIGDH